MIWGRSRRKNKEKKRVSARGTSAERNQEFFQGELTSEFSLFPILEFTRENALDYCAAAGIFLMSDCYFPSVS